MIGEAACLRLNSHSFRGSFPFLHMRVGAAFILWLMGGKGKNEIVAILFMGIDLFMLLWVKSA